MKTTKKRGRPSNHRPILCVENNKVYSTYTAAAKDVGGFASKIYLVANGVQSHHHGLHFEFSKERKQQKDDTRSLECLNI